MCVCVCGGGGGEGFSIKQSMVYHVYVCMEDVNDILSNHKQRQIIVRKSIFNTIIIMYSKQ